MAMGMEPVVCNAMKPIGSDVKVLPGVVGCVLCLRVWAK